MGLLAGEVSGQNGAHSWWGVIIAVKGSWHRQSKTQGEQMVGNNVPAEVGIGQ